MSNRFHRVAAMAIAATLFVSPSLAAGQTIPSVPPTQGSVCPDNNPLAVLACAREQVKTFKAARTKDGKPDLSGYWGGTQIPHENLEAHPRTPDDNGGPTFVVDPADREGVVVDTFAEPYLLIVILVPMGLLFTLIGPVPLATCLFRSP